MVSKQPGSPQGRRQQPLSKGQKWGCGCVSFFLALLLLGSCGALLDDDATPSSTPTATASESPTPTPTESDSPTPTVSKTPSETAQDNGADNDDDHDVTRWRTKKPRPAPTRTRHEAPAPAPYYSNCTEARAAGAAPLHAGEPGYRLGLDRDHDGTACDT